MSDLNDFFAKKDRKKKKAAAKSASASSSRESKPVEKETEADRSSAVSQPKQPDDGWIEIEDPRSAQVNTGGRTVVEFRRGAEEKEANGDGGTQTEKFSGWRKVNPTASENKGASNNAPRSAFPTLADAAKVKSVPTSTSKPSASSAGPSLPSRRPRFVNSQPEKLRQKLAERAAMQPK